MKRSVLFHEIRLFGLVALLGMAALVFAGCHHATTATANAKTNANPSGATSASVAEGSNPANLPPASSKEKAAAPAH